jgi:hypothetical protein
MDLSLYPPPLDRLLTFGDPRKSYGWPKREPDYVAELGLTREHVPGLIRIAQEWLAWEKWPGADDKDVSPYAPIHAWRALGQLGAAEAIGPLLGMLDRMHTRGDDWYLSEFPEVFALIGPVTMESLEEVLHDPKHKEYSRVCMASSLKRIAELHPQTRGAVIEHLVRELSNNDPGLSDLNGLVICDLMDLKATEAAEPIERAFAENCISTMICGDWEEVREALGVEGLGLVPERPAPPPPVYGPGAENLFGGGGGGGLSPGPSITRAERDRIRERRKRERQAKKKNRRR